jgi:microcystin-dependent protein
MKKLSLCIALLICGSVCGAYTREPQTASVGADALNELKNKMAALEDVVKRQTTSSPPNVPIGTILPYAGPIDADHPLLPGWKACDGTPVKVAEYEELWGKCRIQQGNTVRGAWGGDGKPSFNLPDLRGRFLRGVNAVANITIGTKQEDATRMPQNPFIVQSSGDHIHIFNSNPGVVKIYSGVPLNDAGSHHPIAHVQDSPTATQPNGKHVHTITGGDQETRPINAAVNWIIRVK